MKTQQSRIIKRLLETNQISRNECLKNYISRLGAIICDLQKEGWEFNAKFVKTDSGKDYVYYVTKNPYIKVERYVPKLNKKIITYEKNI